MTREDIIDGLKFTVEMFLLDPSTGETITEPRNDMDKTTIDACRGAIELLESEDVLDKIRAEIEQIAKDYDKFNDYRRVRGLWIALDIIDKHKAENEVRNEI